MNKQIIRVVAAVVDTEALTLYKPDGSTYIIKQGDPRLRKIVDEITSDLLLQNWADADVSPLENNAYADFEEQTNGLVKFFRVAKKKLASFFGSDNEPVGNMSVGSVPIEKAQKTMKAIDEIMANATPVTDHKFSENGMDNQENIVEGSSNDIYTPSKHTSTDASDTVIAVVGDKIIPGMEKIKNQFIRANKMGSAQGVQRFLERIGAVAKDRLHSVEDLLKFMERGDLPIADDGSILIYKVLRRHDKKDGVYLDWYTGKVEQWVGAYVCMDKSLVDHNRNQECSNGLHVARRGYINGFNGDVCVIAKLAPEDVITVPAYDANKMRVCGYHILHELSADQYRSLRENKAITNTEEGKLLLGRMLAGNHINRTDEVCITEHQGGGVIVTNLVKKKITKVEEVKPTEALADVHIEVADPVDPKAVMEEVSKLSRKDKALTLQKAYQSAPTKENYEALLNHKKTTKVSWEKLGIEEPIPQNEMWLHKPETAAALDRAVKHAVANPVNPKRVKANVSKVMKKAEAKAPAKAKVKSKAKPKATPAPKAKKPTSVKPVAVPKAATPYTKDGKPVKVSYRDQIAAMGMPTTQEEALAVIKVKREAKKGWTALGVDIHTGADIERLAKK